MYILLVKVGARADFSFSYVIKLHTLNTMRADIMPKDMVLIDLNQDKSINKYDFKNDFDVLSVLRNIKIIGIFTRLSSRDQKHYYLKLIPYAWKLIENRINNNAVFNDLKLFLDNNFSKKMRQKKWKK